MDLNDVALFVQVIRSGSFAAAAKRLEMPANTVSRRIQALERALGLRLMHRSTRKLALTDAGRTLFERCADQVESMAVVARELVQGSQFATGLLRIAAPVDFFSFFPMDWIAEFLALHPHVRIEFILSDARADFIAEGVDFAFRAGRILEPHLVARRLGSTRSTLVASPGYLAGRGMPAGVLELERHDCITFARASARASWTLEGPDGAVDVRVGGRYSASTVQALLGAAIAGLGIALLPRAMTSAAIDAGRLVEVLPACGLNSQGVHLVYLSRRHMPRAMTAFVEFATARMQDRVPQ